MVRGERRPRKQYGDDRLAETGREDRREREREIWEDEIMKVQLACFNPLDVKHITFIYDYQNFQFR
jgi:hypothetical protein